MNCIRCGRELTKEEAVRGDICFNCVKRKKIVFYNPLIGGLEEIEK